MPRNGKSGQFCTIGAKLCGIRGTLNLNKYHKKYNKGFERQPAGSSIPRLQSSPPAAHETWKVGRRIVELHTLADQLDCAYCSSQLSLRNIVRETHHGFGSILYIRCDNCEGDATTKVYTGKRHVPSNAKKSVFDVNSKAALGK